MKTTNFGEKENGCARYNQYFMSASQLVSSKRITQTHLQTFTDNWLLNRFIEKRQNGHDSAYRVAALLRHSMLPFTRDTLITI